MRWEFTWMRQEGSDLLQKLLRAGERTDCSGQALEEEGLELCRGDPLDPPYPSLLTAHSKLPLSLSSRVPFFTSKTNPNHDEPEPVYYTFCFYPSQVATMSTSPPKRTLCPMSANPFISALQ